MVCSRKILFTNIILMIITYIKGARIQEVRHNLDYDATYEPTIQVECKSGAMLIMIKNVQGSQKNGLFSGMIYPKGLPKNSTCLSEYRNHEGALRYKLPLRSCNTMPQESDNGEIEFFNTIVVQPHLKLVTDMGRGFHVRCTYKNREAAILHAKKHSGSSNNQKTAGNPEAYRSKDDDKSELVPYAHNDRRDFARSFDKSSSNAGEEEEVVNTVEIKLSEDNNNNTTTDLSNDIEYDVPMPGIHMKIYNQDKIAENVNIGDPLKLIINIEEQPTYGLYITDCLVRDGLGWGEQKLINENGCPTDSEIMGSFKYSNDRLSASVTFPAHKFPYTTSVYYQCNVKLCSLKNPECSMWPQCNDAKREKRQTVENKDEDDLPATIEVYSGLYVNENADISENDSEVIRRKTNGENELCVSQRTFAIAIAVAGLILMLAIVAAVICIMSKRRTKTLSNSESSIYSGPYTNTAFSHSS